MAFFQLPLALEVWVNVQLTVLLLIAQLQSEVKFRPTLGSSIQ
jgi:hypothetical protein